MNFGSKYVYAYDDSEEECVSDDEFEGGMDRNSSSSSDEEESDGRARGADVELCERFDAKKGSREAPKRKSKGFMETLFSSMKKSTSSSHGESALRTAGGGPPRMKKKKHHWRARSRSPPGASHEFLARRSEPVHGRRWRRADTNVITVKFDQLKAPSNMHTGDPCHCAGCSAVLSKISQLQTVADSEERVWKCEFCGHTNPIDLVDEEIPQAEDVTFMLEPAASTKASGPAGSDQSLVIFCVDISGSMCVTTEVPGKMKLRGSHLERLQSLNDTREPQYLPRQRRDVTFVSRLQAVQAAVDHQLDEIAKDYPNRRICLMTFNTEVTVIGDGAGEPLTIAGGKLSNKEELIETASRIPMPASVKDKKKDLSKKLFDLEEGGMTALGPALLLSVSMASQVPGSKVIICTDGLANVGLGNLDELRSDEIYAQTASFYTDVSNMAVDGGVCVSVLSITGTSCRLVELGKVAEATGGQVNIVDPLRLTQEFGSILADPIIATNVSATLQIHSGLYLRNEEAKESTVTKYVGNVTKSTEITFEYGVKKPPRKPKAKPEVVYDNPQGRVNQVVAQPIVEEADVERENIENETIETVTMATETPSESTPSDQPPTNIEMKSEGAVTKACVSTDLSTSSEPMDTRERAGNAPTSTETPEVTTEIPEVTTEPMQVESAINAPSEPGCSTARETPSENPEHDLKELPFQLQIKYTDLEGAKALRVITQCKPVTRERAQAEKAMNMAALGAHAAQNSARMALTGNYTQSRLNAFMYQRLLHRGRRVTDNREEADDVYGNFYDNVGNMDHAMLQQQRTERSTRGATWSDEEEEEDEEDVRRLGMSKPASASASVPPVPAVKSMLVAPKSKSTSASIGKKGVNRRMNVEDTSAHQMYMNAQISSSAMKKKAPKKE